MTEDEVRRIVREELASQKERAGLAPTVDHGTINNAMRDIASRLIGGGTK